MKHCLILLSFIALCLAKVFDVDTYDLVTKGKHYPICITFNEEKRAVISPVVDKFIRLNIDDPLHKFEEAETSDDGESRVYFSLTVPVLDKEVNSTSRLFTNKKGECYPIATAIISVEKGVVKTITWDNDCYNCNESCDAVSVYRKDGELTIISEDDPSYKLWYSSACTTQICDHLHLFVVWSGTDSNNVPLTSAAQRFSRFEKTTLQSLYDEIYGKN